jgi:hypothetical protein
VAVASDDGGSQPLLDAVVDSNGNLVVPADQLPVSLAPGQHAQLRLVSPPDTLFGVLPELPDLSWEDFEETSRAVHATVEAAVDPCD